MEEDQLAPLHDRGAVQLILKVKVDRLTSHLRPITLLSTDYKLLTKVSANRLLHVLQVILKKGLLSSLKDWMILQRAISLWSLQSSYIRGKERDCLTSLR
jgi:hypothetical protein